MIGSLLGRRLFSQGRSARVAGTTYVVDEALPSRWGLLRWGGHEQQGGAQVELWSTGLPNLPLREPILRLASLKNRYLQEVLGTLTLPDDLDLVVLVRPAGESVLSHRGPWTPTSALSVMEAVSRALDAMHMIGLCHLEVRPEHVLLTGDDRVAMLTGLGQVQAEALIPMHQEPIRRSISTHESLPQPTMLEVCAYLTPEQILPERADRIDRRTDLYALAALGFYLLTGVHPFGDDGEMATLGAHLLAWRPLCTTYRPDLSESVDAVLQRGMALDPHLRPPSCGEFLDDLRAALSEMPRRAPEPGPPPAPSCVLVVAGNAAARRELQAMVSAVAPRHPVLSDDGAHAHSLALRHRPKLVLLHLPSLPESEGLSQCRSLLAEAGPRPQIVALLSHRQSDVAQELTRLGVSLVATHSPGHGAPVQATRPLLQLLRRILAPSPGPPHRR